MNNDIGYRLSIKYCLYNKYDIYHILYNDKNYLYNETKWFNRLYRTLRLYDINHRKNI